MPARIPWVTPSDPLQRKPAASNYPIALNRCYRICGTSGGEPAARWKKRGDQGLVTTNQIHDQPARGLHSFTTPSALRCCSRLASSRLVLARPVAAVARSTTSHPGHGPLALLAASRRTLLARLLLMAMPVFRPAIHATRPQGPRPSGDLLASIIRSPSLLRAAMRNIVSISREDLIVSFTAASSAGSTRTGPCGPCVVGLQGLDARHALTYAHENHVSYCVFWCSVGMFASTSFLRSGRLSRRRA